MTIKLSRIPVNNNDEKYLVIGSMISDTFLKRIVSHINVEALKSAPCKTLMGWVLEYYKAYKCAPKEAINTIFEGNKDYLTDAEEESITKYMAEASEFLKGIPFNEEFYLDRSRLFIKKNSIVELNKKINGLMALGNVEEAEELINKYKSVGGYTLAVTDPFNDDSEWEAAFSALSDPIFYMPGELGNLLNEYLVRASMIEILAPEKRGKTFLMTEFAYVALLHKLNVLIIQAGDLTKAQMYKRLGVRFACRSNVSKYCSSHYSPVVDCVHNQNNTCTLKCRENKRMLKSKTYESPEDVFISNPKYIACSKCLKCSNIDRRKNFKGAVFYEKISEKNPLTLPEILKVKNTVRKVCSGKFRMICVPSGTLSPDTIDSAIEGLYIEENFVPDFIMTDYADILKSDDCKLSERGQINNIFIGLRRLSQKWNSCLMVATQADADANNRELMGTDNFSEDKRKRAHLTVEFTLNQTSYEKRFGVMRIGVLMGREGEVIFQKTATITQDLYRGMPLLDSFMTPIDYQPNGFYKQKKIQKDGESF